MTTQQTPSEPNSTSEEVLAKTAQLVAQQARTLALHIRQHDDMEAQAEEKAKAITERVIADLESTHKTAVDRVAREVEERQNQRFQNEAARILGGVVKSTWSKSPSPESGRWPSKKESSWHTGWPLPATA